ncbi:MAG: hypothetical protein COW85_00195 [Ignavibacteria bacterium CG22_combo_CG10-13_8_21_14_all_37_15]|nr:MAG: hypothetical protein COW85_00195 [Ignavibacteria bacterium CG22_combo_CG10-13_8_21_14_all_37_15]
MYNLIKKLYVKLIRPLISNELDQQRLKLIWFIWGYVPMFRIKEMSLKEKISLFKKFIKTDWNILHSHRPQEISEVIKFLAKRKAEPNEIMIEAGCFNGGSAAKFSHFCKMQGLTLHIFDSFEGVEPLSPELKSIEYDFAGLYAASEEFVWNNLKRFGEPDICKTYKGWFCNTMKPGNIIHPVRTVFIDCDLAKGTTEVLDGIIPKLAKDGIIFSQDYQFPTVRALLNDKNTWTRYGKGLPEVKKLCFNLASIEFKDLKLNN